MKTGKANLFVAICFFIVWGDVVCTIRCKVDEFIVQGVLGKESCAKCPICAIGEGLSPQCGTYVSYGTPIECKPCDTGVTYSTSSDTSSCQPCTICPDHQTIITKCNRTQNSQCKDGTCVKGFYYSQETFDCEECSWCCGDNSDSYASQCKKSGMPFYKQCKMDGMLRCQPRCTKKQFVIVDKSLNKTCRDCPDCAIGQGISPVCSSVMASTDKSKCVDCVPGKTFSSQKDSSSCKTCTVCEVGKKIERSCNSTHNTVCGDCSHGFYEEADKTNKKKTCKACSNCCGDDVDIHVPECKVQAMPQKQQCAYTERAATKCQPKNVLMVVLIVVVSLLAVCFVCGCIIYWRCIRTRYSKLVQASDESQMDNPAVNRVEQQELPSHSSTSTNLEFIRSGVKLECPVEVGKELIEKMSVEVCWPNHFYPDLKEREIYMSPVIKLNPQRHDIKEAVTLEIPHSAYIENDKDSWSIKVLTQILHKTSYCDDDVEWNDLTGMDQDVELKDCSVKVKVTDLAAYVVVGNPSTDPKLAKKRMHCAVFGGDSRTSQPYDISLYVLDDSELSFEKIKQEEKKQGHSMLINLFKSIYPDTNSNIDVTVDNIGIGWELSAINPPTITSAEICNSYKNIPKVEATFVHSTSGDSKRELFRCTFKVKMNNKTLEVPVFNYYQPPAVGIHPCQDVPSTSIQVTDEGNDTVPPVYFNTEKSPTLLIVDLPNDAITKLSQAIDNKSVSEFAAENIPGITKDEIHQIKASVKPVVTLITILKNKSSHFTIANLCIALKNGGFEKAHQELIPYMV